MIQKIRIYKTIDSCIKDVLVSFVMDFQVIKRYLINDGIIKVNIFLYLNLPSISAHKNGIQLRIENIKTKVYFCIYIFISK